MLYKWQEHKNTALHSPYHRSPLNGQTHSTLEYISLLYKGAANNLILSFSHKHITAQLKLEKVPMLSFGGNNKTPHLTHLWVIYNILGIGIVWIHPVLHTYRRIFGFLAYAGLAVDHNVGIFELHIARRWRAHGVVVIVRVRRRLHGEIAQQHEARLIWLKE